MKKTKHKVPAFSPIKMNLHVELDLIFSDAHLTVETFFPTLPCQHQQRGKTLERSPKCKSCCCSTLNYVVNLTFRDTMWNFNCVLLLQKETCSWQLSLFCLINTTLKNTPLTLVLYISCGFKTVFKHKQVHSIFLNTVFQLVFSSQALKLPRWAKLVRTDFVTHTVVPLAPQNVVWESE